MGACGVVVVGFVLGSAGELKFSWAGLIFGLVSSVFVALYGIYVKKVMHVLHDDHWYVGGCCASRELLYRESISNLLLDPIQCETLWFESFVAVVAVVQCADARLFEWNRMIALAIR